MSTSSVVCWQSKDTAISTFHWNDGNAYKADSQSTNLDHAHGSSCKTSLGPTPQDKKTVSVLKGWSVCLGFNSTTADQKRRPSTHVAPRDYQCR